MRYPGNYCPTDIALLHEGDARTRDKSFSAFYAPHKSRHHIRKVKRHDDGPHTFSVCLLCTVYRGLTRLNLVAREREREGASRDLWPWLSVMYRRMDIKSWKGFTLVIPPPPPPPVFLDMNFSHETLGVEISPAPEIWISAIWISPPKIFNPRRELTASYPDFSRQIISINKILPVGVSVTIPGNRRRWNYIYNRIIHLWKSRHLRQFPPPRFE